MSDSKKFADFDESPSSDEEENGLIVGHIVYKLATDTGGSLASAKKILLQSIDQLNNSRDGNSSQWSFEDLRLAMIEGVKTNSVLVGLIEDVFDDMREPAVTGSGSGCSLQPPIGITAVETLTCNGLGGTNWRVSWTEVCPAQSDYFEIWVNFTNPPAGMDFAIEDSSSPGGIAVYNGSGNVRMRACNQFYCSGFSGGPFVSDNC